MPENVRPSFDQHVAKRGEFPQVKAAREKYEAAVKKLSGVFPDDANYNALREAKKNAGVALSEARQAAEAEYYKEQIAENKEQLQKMKEAQSAAPAAKA
jgi:hypothetical protein